MWWAYRRFSRRLFFVSGLVLILIGLGLALHTLSFLHHAERANGKVITLRQKVDDDGVTFAPTFNFVAVSGQSYTVDSNSYSRPAGFEEGEAVSVLYLQSAPETARIDSFWQVWAMETICVALGSFFVLVALAMRWWLARPKA